MITSSTVSTGRDSSEILIFARQGAETEIANHLKDRLGVQPLIQTCETDDRMPLIIQETTDQPIVLPHLGVAIVQRTLDRLQQLESLAVDSSVEGVLVSNTSGLFKLAEEPILLAVASSALKLKTARYWQGYRDAINDLIRVFRLTNSLFTQVTNEYQDDDRGTWGLHATGVLKSRYTGQGVRVAALVDGLDMAHPDWIDRQIVMQSFVPGEPPTAFGSSGTHYLGTALGTAHPAVGSRYGCASNAIPYVAKVLNRTGSGSRTSIFAALDWAIGNRCRVILLPLGWSNPVDDPIMERLAARVADRGGLLIAGTGNNARRNEENFGQVINPAACPSVVGVGSLDANLNLPEWTPRSSEGKKIDVVAPGVNLRSSLPTPQLYGLFSGSATAAAYVAGIAALWAEALPNANSYQLWQALVSNAQDVPLSNQDVGSGLVQAPQIDAGDD